MKTGHEDLKEYERGTTTFLGEVGHWHATEIGGRQWIKVPASECPAVRKGD